MKQKMCTGRQILFTVSIKKEKPPSISPTDFKEVPAVRDLSPKTDQAHLIQTAALERATTQNKVGAPTSSFTRPRKKKSRKKYK